MKKILFGWEAGHGLGHVHIIAPIARRLRDSGHELVFALKDLDSTRSLWKPLGRAVQAPPWPTRRVVPSKAPIVKTMADVLHSVGGSEPEFFGPVFEAWERLLRTERPDLVVAEMAPLLGPICSGRVPLIVVGFGYSTPPAGLPSMPIRPWERAVPVESLRREALVVDAARRALAAVGRWDLDIRYVGDLFNGDEVFPCTYPALDGYRAYRETPAIGPVRATVETAVDSQHREGVFAYLSGLRQDAGLVLQGLAQSGLMGECYVRELQPAHRRRLEDGGWKVHDQPQDLPRLLPGKRLMIHHGGISTSHLCLHTGTPQLLLPNHTEQLVNAAALKALGCAIGLARAERATPAIVSEALQAAGRSEAMLDRAGALRTQLLEERRESAEEVVARACLQLMG